MLPCKNLIIDNSGKLNISVCISFVLGMLVATFIQSFDLSFTSKNLSMDYNFLFMVVVNALSTNLLFFSLNQKHSEF